MRPLCLTLVLFVSSVPVLAQQENSHELAEGNFYIPVELKKSLRAEKLHAGQEVQFEALEGVLIAPGVVLPDGAKLYGHILDSEPLEHDAPSRISVVVEKAVWKSKVFPLHAFMFGWGKRRVVQSQGSGDCGFGISPRPAELGSSGNDRASHPGEGAPNPLDCAHPSQDRDVALEHANDLRGILLYHRPDGSTGFLSTTKNVHLSGGTLIMLRNVSWQPPKQALAAAASQVVSKK